jgi:hypothetical protein
MIEPANGCTGARPRASNWADEAGAGFPACKRTYDRDENNAARDREAEARGVGDRERFVPPPTHSYGLLTDSKTGKFKMPASVEPGAKPATLAEMAASLLKLEAEKIEVVPNTEAGKASVLSDEDLEILLDRRPEVFADRKVGWMSSQATAAM